MILGDIFLKKYFSVYYYENSTIGLGPSIYFYNDTKFYGTNDLTTD